MSRITSQKGLWLKRNMTRRVTEIYIWEGTEITQEEVGCTLKYLDKMRIVVLMNPCSILPNLVGESLA